MMSRVAPRGEFFGFNPVPTRIALGVGAAMCAILAFAGGLRPALRTGDALAWTLFGAYVFMTLLFAGAAFHLRPRQGWGVTIGPRVLTVARPLLGAPIEVELEVLDRPRRSRPDALVLEPQEGTGELVISRHLFPSRAAFHRMVETLEDRLPKPRYDA